MGRIECDRAELPETGHAAIEAFIDGWNAHFDLAPPRSEASGRIAVGWFACGRIGRDDAERLAFGAAELAA